NATDTVSFNSEGGSAVGSLSGLDGTTITLPCGPTRAGDSFACWFVAASGGSALSSPYLLGGSVTLHAQWTANATDTVSFNSEGRSEERRVGEEDRTTITLPGGPTNAGYSFAGWFVAASGGSALSSPCVSGGSVM